MHLHVFDIVSERRQRRACTRSLHSVVNDNGSIVLFAAACCSRLLGCRPNGTHCSRLVHVPSLAHPSSFSTPSDSCSCAPSYEPSSPSSPAEAASEGHYASSSAAAPAVCWCAHARKNATGISVRVSEEAEESVLIFDLWNRSILPFKEGRS